MSNPKWISPAVSLYLRAFESGAIDERELAGLLARLAPPPGVAASQQQTKGTENQK